jgi:predicted nucleic acid-binding protein
MKHTQMISSAEKGDLGLAMCVIHLGEVWYAIARDYSSEVADHYTHIVRGMAIEIVDADWALTRQAAEYKKSGGISYADCFAAALAKARNAELVTGDKEFKKLENEIKILWL